ncbi:uncharacterized protein BO87DRAFT_455671 [Aspergillus neoniger CBS 115656]|uniref:Uncharacterized protein n=1 Tax=Aspergillus neoniger (strain CBS 115656) TaxID=1448310 RepID=A0A318YUM5_ASPNB|nr:hypothetical protein BO87DRAFT_455671 [Aspergillus neoniger CBS 115656]PYH38089.1 hypothetical protein BO87DRAFT_455671 [Aspergillus neoniger CBS 115656]
MNITNSTMEQDRCAGHSETPTLSYPYYCAIAIWQHGLNRTQDPYADLVKCCKSNQYSYYGEDNRAAYCNATKDTQSTLMDCLTEGHRLQSIGCSSGKNSGSVSSSVPSLKSYLVLAVVLSGLCQL